MTVPKQHEEIVSWLQQRGQSPEEIDQILVRLAAYDQTIVRDALFDSMSSGTFDLDAILKGLATAKK